MSVHTEITGQEKADSPDVTHKSQSVCSKCSSTQQKGKNPLLQVPQQSQTLRNPKLKKEILQK